MIRAVRVLDDVLAVEAAEELERGGFIELIHLREALVLLGRTRELAAGESHRRVVVAILNRRHRLLKLDGAGIGADGLQEGFEAALRRKRQPSREGHTTPAALHEVA